MENNVEEQILGKVTPVPKGEYNSLTQYYRLNIVGYNGNSYIAKTNVQGQAPTNTTYWQLLAKQGDKPVYKVDYLTDAEMEGIVNDIIEDSTNAFNQNATAKTTAFNNNATDKTTAFNNNATSKTSDFNTNASSKTTAFNSNASDKQSDFNSNASSTKDDFDRNATAKTEAYDDNATSKTNSYNSNASDKTTAYNNNATDKTTAYNNNHTDKLGAYNDNASAKTTAFNENASEKTTEFNENASALQEELDRYKTLENAMPHVTGTGESITLNDTANSPLNLELEPTELSQDSEPSPSSPQDIHTISGDNTVKVENSNIIPNNLETMKTDNIAGSWTSNVYYQDGLTYTINNDKSVKITGTATEDTSFWIKKIFNLKAGNYVLSGCKSGGTTNTYSFELMDENYQEITRDYGSNSSFSIVNNKDVRLIFRAKSGQQFNDTIKPMINKGSIATTYVPYQEQIAQLNLPVENLLNIQNGTYTAAGITAVASNGKIVLNGTSTDTAFIGIDLNAPVNFTSDKSYTLSAFNPAVKSGTDDANVLRISEEGGATVLQTPLNRTNSYATTSNKDKSNLKLVVRIANGETFNNFEINPQLEVGTKSNSYSQYGTTPLEYCKIGDYKDRFFKNIPEDADYDALRELGKWYLKKNIGKVVLDGSEDGWSINNMAIAKGYFLIINDMIANTSNSTTMGYLTNYFIEVSPDYNWTHSEKNFTITTDYKIRFNVGDTTDKLDDFKTWLGTHNVIFYYSLSTPTYTLLNNTLQSQLETIYNKLLGYQEQTNISQENNDLAFNINAKAIYDLNKLVERVTTLENE